MHIQLISKMLENMKMLIILCMIVIMIVIVFELYQNERKYYIGTTGHVSHQPKSSSPMIYKYIQTSPGTKKHYYTVSKGLPYEIEPKISKFLFYNHVTFESTNISYSFHNVSKDYSGPIVDGWPPSKSRHVPSYIAEQTVLYDVEKNCSKGNATYNNGDIDGNLQLLIMQHSFPTNFEARQSSRNTWMKLLKV